MAGPQQEQDRTEPASPFKLREAKKRGQVAKSLEVNSFVVLGTALALSYGWGEAVAMGQLRLSRGLFSQAHEVDLQPGAVVGLFSGILADLTAIWWLLVAGVIAMAVLANLLQTGPVLSGHPLKPDFQRLNPTQNLRRLFSARLLFETGKTLVKLSCFAGCLYLAIAALLPVLLGAADRDPHSYAPFLLHTARGLAFELLLVLLLVALIDLLYVRWDYARNLRMSRRELREELRRREGDPLVRARMRELQKEAARRSSALRRVPEADVLITNPVHLAVALRYERAEMAAPTLIAKGAGEHAARMRALALRHRVPIVEDRPLARALFHGVAIDQAIPEEHYAVVARILAQVFRARRAPAPPAPGEGR